MHKGKLFLLLILLITLVSCSSEHSKIIVAEFGNHQINLDEFENAYLKTSGGDKAVKDSSNALEKFLDLYVDYKMKLKDAEVRGYPDDITIQKDFHDYKIKTGSSLILNKYLFEPNLHKLYEKRKVEYRLCHILLNEDPTMNKEQVLELAAQLIKRIQNGEDFAKLAKEYSKDNSTKYNGGDVSYLTAGQIDNKAIEDAIYNTEPGHVYPEPVKSLVGYHIIKITQKQPRIHAVKVSHILIHFEIVNSLADTAKAYKIMEDVQQQLKNGADFYELLKKYGDDLGIEANRGRLGFIERGQTDLPFDDAIFKLKVGEVSPIVRSSYGYHIIKCEAIAPMPSFEDNQEELKKIYTRRYYKNDLGNLTEKFKTEFGYKLNQATFNKILADADTAKINDGYFGSNLQKQDGNKEIFSMDGKSFIVDSLISDLIKDVRFKNQKFNADLLNEGVRGYSAAKAVEEKALIYDKEDPQFATLLDDNQKGTYLLKILNEEVWSKISIDSVKLKNLYDQTKENYRWNDRVQFKTIFSFKDSVINNCYSMVASGYNFDSASVKFKKESALNTDTTITGLMEVDTNELAKRANELKNVGEISKPFKYEKGWAIVKLIKRELARVKTFEEAKPEVSSVLHDKESKRLEEVYLEKLKSIYNPKLYYNELKNAFKQSN